jgi:hypothetical protein
MPSSEEKSWIVPLFVITFLAIVVGVLYYISTDYYKQRFSQGREEFDYGGRPVQSTATADQVILTKNEKLILGRTCLVFRGVKKKMIIVDLYLLDLDPEQPYEKRFSKKIAKKEMMLGEGRYRLISVNNQHLVLKTIH